MLKLLCAREMLGMQLLMRIALCREEWARFSESVTAAERAAQMAEGGFAFAFKEGALVKALRHGHWVLLDEINLAPPEVRRHNADPLSVA